MNEALQNQNFGSGSPLSGGNYTGGGYGEGNATTYHEEGSGSGYGRGSGGYENWWCPGNGVGNDYGNAVSPDG